MGLSRVAGATLRRSMDLFGLDMKAVYVPIPNTYSPPYRNYSLIDGSSLWYLTSREGIVGYSTLNVN